MSAWRAAVAPAAPQVMTFAIDPGRRLSLLDGSQ